ncbi:MAG: hypothetical protein EXQ52_03380 [Bryobacterales bacterium]|nr:hypothetical protein [Bryobacterales bacterium]
MAAFRKVFLALVVVALAAATASAQTVSCNGTAGSNIVRTEGITELLGDIFLQCTGTAAAAGAATFNIQVSLNTNSTAAFSADPLIDTVLNVTPTPGGVAGATVSTRGRKASDTSVSFLAVSLPVAPGGTTSNIQISNLRGNASGVAAGSPITAFVTSNNTTVGGTPLTLNNTTFTVGSPSTSLTSRIRLADNSDTKIFTGLQCANNNSDLFSDATKTNQTLSGNVQFREQQQAAFKTAAQEAGSFVVPATFGVPTNGTRVRTVFNNIPANVALFVTTRDVASGTTGFSTTIRKLELVSADSTGAGGVATGAADGVGAAVVGPAGSGGDARVSAATPARYAIQQLTVSNGTATATWEVVGTDPNATEDLSVGFVLAFKAGQPALGTGTVNANLGPVSTSKVPVLPGAPPAGASIPRFTDVSSATNVFTLAPCATNLLFPYTTNQAGFDTGLVISNTSSDPFGTSGQAGTCTLNYYGSTTGGGAAPAAVTTQSVPAGGQVVWTLSSGGNLGATATPGFQGYVIAQCQFRFGHGFAFVSDVGARNVAMGYLALVMDPGTSPRDTKTTGEAFSQ